jgi:hypothetical protein
MKRYIYIILGIIVLAAIAIGVILFFRKQSLSSGVSDLLGSLPGVGTQTIGTSTGSVANNTTPTSSASSTTATKTGVLSVDPVIAYFVSVNDNVITVHPDGIVEAISNGQSTYLSSSEIANVLSATFSYDGKKILVSFGDPIKPQWTVFDTGTKAWTSLPVSPVVVAWSPANYQIAYFATVNGVSALETIDLGSKNPKPVFVSAFPGEDFQLLWKSPSDVLLEDRPSALFSGSIFDVNIKTATISTVVVNKVGLETQWNASGTMAVILAGTQLARGGQLGIINNSGLLLHQLTFLTLPSKCVFPAAVGASSTVTTNANAAPKNAFSTFGLICAIPRNADSLNNNPLPDAYSEKMISTSDDFYAVSLSSGTITPLFVNQSQNFDASDITLSNDALYFINRYDSKLYSLTLTQ